MEKEAFFNSQEFLYNHQPCPRIYLGNSVALMREGDEDSYGLFEYVSSHPRHKSVSQGEDEESVVLQIFGESLGISAQGEGDSRDLDLLTLLDSAEHVIG